MKLEIKDVVRFTSREFADKEMIGEIVGYTVTSTGKCYQIEIVGNNNICDEVKAEDVITKYVEFKPRVKKVIAALGE